MLQADYDPRAFEDVVTRHGGRADFVFADERPFAQCHASTVARTPDGDLVCAWFGGAAEKNPDVGIWTSRFTEGAWSPPECVAKVSQTAHWNPVLFHDPARGLYLFFKVGPEVRDWQTYWMGSEDGRTWSEPMELVPGDKGGRGPVKNKPIVTSSGAWLAPASTELAGWLCFADRSEDGGLTWQRSDDFELDSAACRGKGAIQPTFWESSPGRIHALARTTGGRIARTDSQDDGRTWRPMRMTDLPNNNSGIDALGLAGGRVLLVYNPVGEDWGPRTPLNLAVSSDDGETWKDLANLEDEEGEYSYPAIVATADGVVIAYTWRRERIRCWQIPTDVLG